MFAGTFLFNLTWGFSASSLRKCIEMPVEIEAQTLLLMFFLPQGKMFALIGLFLWLGYISNWEISSTEWSGHHNNSQIFNTKPCTCNICVCITEYWSCFAECFSRQITNKYWEFNECCWKAQVKFPYNSMERKCWPSVNISIAKEREQ